MTLESELLARLETQASQSPPAGSRTLSIRGEKCGTLVSHTYDVLRSPAFYNIFEETGSGLDLPFAGENACACLAELAEKLHKGGLIFQWRNELLDIASTDSGRKLAKAERGLFRFLGLTTTCVHALARSDDNRFWIAKRSDEKQVDPGLFDTLSGGLSSAGETPTDTLYRETFEEAGLKPDDYTVLSPVEFLVTRPVREGWMRERTIVYSIQLKAGARPVNQDGEVTYFETIDASELLKRIDAGKLTLDAALAFLYTLSGRPHS